jgi:predicted Zn-dependent protease with MMP-like domain
MSSRCTYPGRTYYHGRMVRVSAKRFEVLAGQVIAELPAWVRRELANVHLAVEARPPVGQRGLQGLYEGVPLTMRDGQYTGPPDKITLYRSTIRREAATEAELVAALRQVIVHEVAHLMGISDRQLRDMGRY